MPKAPPAAQMAGARHVALCAEACLGRYEYQDIELRGTRRQSARPGMSTARIALGGVVHGRLRSNAAMLRG